MSGRFRAGLWVAAGIVGFGTLLGLLAVAGRPHVIRRPDPVARPVLLVPEFQNRTGNADLFGFADRLTEAVRERLDGDPAAIFALSPRRLHPVLTAAEREVGLLRIAGRLGADYVLVGTLESGPGPPLGPGSSWGAPPGASSDQPLADRTEDPAGGPDPIRLDVLLVRDSDPPHVFAERFPLGPANAPDHEHLARIVADRIALSLRRP